MVSITFPENQPKNADDKTVGRVPAIDESLDGTEYRNRTGSFSGDSADGRDACADLSQSKDVVASLQSPDRTLFFLVTPEKFGDSLATYKVLAETQYQEKVREYVQLTETGTERDGRQGIRMTFQGTPANNNTLCTFLIYILPYDARMVRLSFLTFDPLFTDAVPIFEKIAVSYHSVGVRDS